LRGIAAPWWHSRHDPATGISAKRNLFETGPSHLPRVLRATDPAAVTIGPMEGHDRTEKLADSPQLFESEFLNFFSRVHPAIPAVVFVPVIVIMEWLGADRGLPAWELVLLTLAGAVIWTLTEYWLHRLVFHWEPDNTFGRRMHFIIHGIHHDHPNDKLRLVMPPAVSIPLAALFFIGFTLLFGTPQAYPLFAGFIGGYLVYDYMHYYVHHFVPKSTLGKKLREQHMRHHFQDHRFGFGVSSPLWDAVFRTMPRRRRS
jgi:sterol desaturase/sphingolipid hydroxylase (fatty acid hydroxylase superfamily)